MSSVCTALYSVSCLRLTTGGAHPSVLERGTRGPRKSNSYLKSEAAQNTRPGERKQSTEIVLENQSLVRSIRPTKEAAEAELFWVLLGLLW